MLARTLELAAKHQIYLEGVVTWAFEFENQPYFEGFRSLAINGIDKPVLNAFRMFGLLGTDRIALKSTQSLETDSVLRSGVSGQADINGIATVQGRKLSVILWNYHDRDAAATDAAVEMIVTGLPKAGAQPLLHHYRIDEIHSNAYTSWKEMGSPQQPTAEQYKRLASRGRLQELAPPQGKSLKQGELRIGFRLPRHAISLLLISW
jgi:xylan 1,4-beta-xylosidase